jgi:hypothetical protein
VTRSWSNLRDDGGTYPSWHIRRDNVTAFCGRMLPIGSDFDSFEPPNEHRTCETCFKREREQQPPKGADDAPNP